MPCLLIRLSPVLFYVTLLFLVTFVETPPVKAVRVQSSFELNRRVTFVEALF